MPRKRNSENNGLPERWRYYHGAYYYQVPVGHEGDWDGKKQFRLGKSLSEAYKAWTAKITDTGTVRTIGDLLDRYVKEVIPTKAITTQGENYKYVEKLRPVFGALGLRQLKPRHIYQYIDNATGKILARRQIALLSHAFTKAVEWGDIDRHPFKGEVRLKSEKPRNRYVEDWEIAECLSLKPRRNDEKTTVVQAYLRIKTITGITQSDLLRLQPAKHFTDEGIDLRRNKVENTTGKRTIILWSPELRNAVEVAKAARPIDISPWLFCNKMGMGYVDEKTGKPVGWRSMWKRFMKRVLDETEVKEPFTEHDLRAKAGSDASSLEHARALLSHSDSQVTQRVYRRKAEKVLPIR